MKAPAIIARFNFFLFYYYFLPLCLRGVQSQERVPTLLFRNSEKISDLNQ